MAGSRLPNFGTIFSRATGLISTGALKDVPIWYNVYKKYPPELEPNIDRPIPPQDPIPELVYEEDFSRSMPKRGEHENQTTDIKVDKVDQLVDGIIDAAK